MPDWISSRVKSTSVCTSSTPTPSRQGRPSRLTRGDAGSGHRAPLVRAWIASTMYPLGLDRLASTGASLTGSDPLGPPGPPVSRPWCMVRRRTSRLFQATTDFSGIYEILMDLSNYWQRQNNNPEARTRDIHTASRVTHVCEKAVSAVSAL